jgi:hypothetical protein
MWRIGDEEKLLSVSRSFLSSAGAGSSSMHGSAAAGASSNLTHLDVRRIPGVEALADQGKRFPPFFVFLAYLYSAKQFSLSPPSFARQ